MYSTLSSLNEVRKFFGQFFELLFSIIGFASMSTWKKSPLLMDVVLLLGFGACHNVAASEQEVPSIHNGNSFPWKCCFILSFDHNFANHCLD
jgi:hypothetical protein